MPDVPNHKSAHNVRVPGRVFVRVLHFENPLTLGKLEINILLRSIAGQNISSGRPPDASRGPPPRRWSRQSTCEEKAKPPSPLGPRTLYVFTKRPAEQRYLDPSVYPSIRPSIEGPPRAARENVRARRQRFHSEVHFHVGRSERDRREKGC